MNTRNKFALLTGTAMHFAPMSACSIEGEGNDNAGGGGSSGGDSQADGNADAGSVLTAEQQMEKEFHDPNDEPESGDEGDDGEGGDDSGADGGDEGGDGEGADNGDESGQQGEEEGDQPPKKTGRMQERFDELTSQSRNHEREAEKWKAEAIKLGYVEGANQPELPDEPDPEKYPYGEHDPDYLRDKGKYDAKVEMIQEQASARFKAEASALDAKWTKNLAEKAEAYPDFDEVVVKGAANWACPPVVAIAIKDSDVGPDIAYQLAKDPAEALRVSKLSPLEQAREFGRKESDFKSSKRISELEAEVAKLKGKTEDANGKPKPPARIVSKAPEPPRRRVSGGGARSETPADTDDFAAFERMADKKIEERSKRS